MSSLQYNEVFSRFFSKVTAYDFLDMTDLQSGEYLCSWIHSTFSKIYIRKLFARSTSLTLDDEIQLITYKLDYEIDEETDREFLIEVLAYGMIVEWLNPKIMNITNISQVFGSSDEKFFSQGAHLSELRNLRDDAVKHQRSLISDRGFIYNSYLDKTNGS